MKSNVCGVNFLSEPPNFLYEPNRQLFYLNRQLFYPTRHDSNQKSESENFHSEQLKFPSEPQKFWPIHTTKLSTQHKIWHESRLLNSNNINTRKVIESGMAGRLQGLKAWHKGLNTWRLQAWTFFDILRDNTYINNITCSIQKLVTRQSQQTESLHNRTIIFNFK